MTDSADTGQCTLDCDVDVVAPWIDHTGAVYAPMADELDSDDMLAVEYAFGQLDAVTPLKAEPVDRLFPQSTFVSIWHRLGCGKR
ncbi:MAG: hypothetical protein ABJN72_00125 [Sulfitobacter sp.]